MNINYITDHLDEHKQNLIKRFMDPNVLDKIMTAHAEYVEILAKQNRLNRMSNIFGKLTGTLLKTKQTSIQILDVDFEELLTFTNQIKVNSFNKENTVKVGKTLKELKMITDEICKNIVQERDKLISTLPVLVSDKVFVSKNEDDNVIIKETCKRAKLDTDFHQYDICQKLGLIEDASKLSGERGYFMVNDLVKLNYALVNYALDFLQRKGYKLMYTPHFMNKSVFENVCQLSEFEDTLYKLENDKHLIATSEQPLTAYFAGKRLNANELPIKCAGMSTCYRKEAGKHGIDTSGIFRVHQFEKVEQFFVTNPEDSWNAMEQLIQTAEEFYQSLGIEYRIVNIVSGALNNAAAMKYDLEGWFRGSNAYRELVSCSNTLDFFSRKLHIKNTKDEFVHMLNSTLFANTRTMCCLLESHQEISNDGKLQIKVPDVLVTYMGKKYIN